MAQAGYTPIQLYFSTTAAAVPLAANLAQGELAINITDGKLYYENNSGVVTLLASAAGASGDVVGPASATDNALARFDLTTGKLIQNSVGILSDAGILTGLTGITSSGSITFSGLTSGRVTYAGTGGLLQDSANFTFNGTTVTMANDASISGLTVGKGASAVATNTAVGASALVANTSGNNNTAIGQTALTTNTSGSFNTAIGRQALFANLDGTDNSALGVNALVANISGAYNTAIGRSALQLNTASNNTAVGYQAGYSNVTGTANAFLGVEAGYTVTSDFNTGVGALALRGNTVTGTRNTAVGRAALYVVTSGGSNTAVGMNSMIAHTTGSFNTAIGESALAANTTASGNTAVGYQASYSMLSSSGITAVGYRALYTNTTANNTAVGYQALFTNVGQSNVAMGNNTLYANTSGEFNVGIGDLALRFNTTASNNTAVGYQAGYLTTVANNTFLGTYSGYYNTTGVSNVALGYGAYAQSGTSATGSNNIAIGDNSLRSIQSGSNNTAVGYQAGYNITLGQYNTALGENAGRTNSTSSSNTMIGRYAGYYATGANNTFVGMSSGDAVTSGAGNTILGRYTGNNGGLDIRTSSNYIVLSDGDGNPRFNINQRGDAGLNCAIFEWSSYTHLAIGNASCSVYNFSNYELGTVQNAYYGTGAWRFAGSGPKASWVIQYDGNWSVRGTSNTGSTGTGITWTTLLQAEKDKTIAIQGANQAAGTGITFPASQNASSDANTLDDYEEGTWTPSLPNGGTLVVNHAVYTKIGRQVTVSFYVEQIAPTNNSSEFLIGGIPFTIKTNDYYAGSFGFVGDTNLSNWLVLGLTNSVTIGFRVTGNSTARLNSDYVALAALGSADSLIINLTYFV